MNTKKYGRNAFAALIDNDWKNLSSWHEVREDGIWVRPLDAHDNRAGERFMEIRSAHPKDDLDQPALTFPFTAAEFVSFCTSAPIFDWDYVERRYSNEDVDDFLDEPAIERLAKRSPMAAELVRARLSGEGVLTDSALPYVRPEKAIDRNDRVLLEMLADVGIDPAKVPREKGGGRASTKSKVLALVATPKYAAQRVTRSTIEKAWERIPKVDPSDELPSDKVSEVGG